MKTIDKVVATFVCAVLLCSGLLYIRNFDMYESVKSYNPIGGFAALADKLSDTEWVTTTCDYWPTSESPVMQSLYSGLTTGDPEVTVTVIKNNRLIQVVAMMLSLVLWPVSVITSAVRAKPKEAATNG